jgi:N-acetylglutamate synthase-like GNAT family acetyltransferase
VKHLSVLPRWRRGFIATRLLEEIEQCAIERKCSRIYAVTGPFHSYAVSLLKKVGFVGKDPYTVEEKDRTYFYEKQINLKIEAKRSTAQVKTREPTKWG